MYLKERQGDHVINASVKRWTIYGMKFSEIRNPIRFCAGCSSISYFWRMVGGSDWAACDAWSSAHEASLTRDCASLYAQCSAVQRRESATVLYKRCYVHAYVMRLCTHCIRITRLFLVDLWWMTRVLVEGALIRSGRRVWSRENPHKQHRWKEFPWVLFKL